MFDEQPLYQYESVATPLKEGDLFHNYEIKSWVLSSRLYKIIAISAFLNIAFLLIAAQISLLTRKSCDSPLIGTVCQVLDTVYVASVLSGTSREYVDDVYEETDLGDSDITYIDTSDVPPPLTYPTGYFQIANPGEETAILETVDNKEFTKGIPGIPNGFPITSPSTGSLFNTKDIVPKSNPHIIDGYLPRTGNSHPTYDPPIARRKRNRGGRATPPNPESTPGIPGDTTAENNPPAAPSPPPQTLNGDAFQHYQQGRVLIERGHGGDFQNALASFERAIELDPNYAAAYVGKADAKIRIFWGSTLQRDISQARTAINKAIELDESNSYAHTLLCRIKGTYDWDFAGAEKECQRAIELDPNDHEARREIAFFLSAVGREDEAMREIDAAVLLAPTSFNKRSRGMILYYSRRYDEAIEQLRQVELTDPGFMDSRNWLMNCYEMKKDYTGALEARIRQMKYAGATPEEIAAVKAAFDKDGWPSVLRTMVDPIRPTMAGTAPYAQLGEIDKAFESLEKMFDRRAIMLMHSAREPRLDPIRNDPRFDDLLKRIGLK